MIALAAAAMLVSCRSDPDQSASPAAQSADVVDIGAVIRNAGVIHRPILILITESATTSTSAPTFLQAPAIKAKSDVVTLVIVDITNSRNRAAAARFHLADTPMLIGLSSMGVIISRDEKPITQELVLQRIEQAELAGPSLDEKLNSLQKAVDNGKDPFAAKLNLADFLIAQHNDAEAIPLLAWVAHCPDVEVKIRVQASVSLARAHLWVGEPEKGRHEAKNLIATLGPQSPDALAGGNFVLGLQDSTAKRFELARREFENSINAAPDSVYAKQAADAVAKLPPGNTSTGRK